MQATNSQSTYFRGLGHPVQNVCTVMTHMFKAFVHYKYKVQEPTSIPTQPSPPRHQPSTGVLDAPMHSSLWSPCHSAPQRLTLYLAEPQLVCSLIELLNHLPQSLRLASSGCQAVKGTRGSSQNLCFIQLDFQEGTPTFIVSSRALDKYFPHLGPRVSPFLITSPSMGHA